MLSAAEARPARQPPPPAPRLPRPPKPLLPPLCASLPSRTATDLAPVTSPLRPRPSDLAQEMQALPRATREHINAALSNAALRLG